MKIQLLSDLHLEQNPDFKPEAAPGSELLILAGDIGACMNQSRRSNGAEHDFGLQRFADWPTPVAYLPGNHEYDGQDVDATYRHLQSLCESFGIHWLERRQLRMDGVRVLGTTLWTDFEALAPAGPPAARQAAIEQAMKTANRYLCTTKTTRQGRPWMAHGIRAESQRCQQWLRQVLAEPFDGSTVVVTHFAPSLRSTDPRFPINAATAGFCNRLDDLFPQADIWMHGHLHWAQDYRAGRCHIIANPLGYPVADEQRHFQPQRLICVPV